MDGLASHRGVRQVFEIAGMCLHRYTTDIRPCFGENTPFPWCERVGGARPAQGSAPGRRQGTTGTMVRQVWKNNGSAVETEPHGEASTIGDEKTLDINGLARAALEREREVREYRAEAADRGRSPDVNAEKQPWRRKRGSGSEDSPGNRGDSLENRADSLENRGVVPRAYIRVFSPVFPCYAVRRL